MNRLFDQHTVRKVVSLDGTWTYTFPQTGSSLALGEIASGAVARIPVPGMWESLPERVNYRGQAIAETNFTTHSDGPIRLVFKGVSHTCRVYVDGVGVGGHHNAYTPFSITLSSLPKGEHRLQVWISNEYGELSALHVPNDYYCYGGITRPVELQLLQSTVYLRQVHFTPQKTEDGWMAKLALDLTNLGETTESVRLSVLLADLDWHEADLEVEPGIRKIERVLGPLAVNPWSPSSPSLYPLTVKLESTSGSDDWRDRVGFRTVATQGQHILLNGEPCILKGFNRHEDHPDFGCAVPVEMMRKDLQLCRDMGANAIRTAHYPNDERFLDLCDELGLLVWEENHARGLTPEAPGPRAQRHPMEHPRFREQCRLCNLEMVSEHFNHPSIIIWGVLNECDTESDYGRSCYAEQLTQIRELDPSRPHTFATYYQGRDRCQDLPDICSWNLYPKWYGGVDTAEHFSEFLQHHEALMENKPLIISEFGAGALPNFHDPIRRGKWSEERQADILDECLGVYLGHPRVCGVFIWQFCDVRVDEVWAMSRPRTMNNKGVVDEYRRPKLAFDTVQKHFQNKP